MASRKHGNLGVDKDSSRSEKMWEIQRDYMTEVLPLGLSYCVCSCECEPQSWPKHLTFIHTLPRDWHYISSDPCNVCMCVFTSSVIVLMLVCFLRICLCHLYFNGLYEYIKNWACIKSSHPYLNLQVLPFSPSIDFRKHILPNIRTHAKISFVQCMPAMYTTTSSTAGYWRHAKQWWAVFKEGNLLHHICRCTFEYNHICWDKLHVISFQSFFLSPLLCQHCGKSYLSHGASNFASVS